MKRKFAIFLVLLALVMSVATVSATTYTVDPGCTAASPPACDGLPTTFTTIQAAINAASPGDTININDGTYAEVLNISTDNLTIIGNSEAGVIIDATASSGYHMFVDADDIHLEKFTLNGSSSGTYGIKAQGVVPTKATNLTIIDVTVNDTKNTGVDLNGIDGATLTNITVNDVTSGNGVAMTDVDNAILTNITTSGNAWGGVAIYTGGGWFPSGSNNVTLSGINGSETNPLYVELAPDGSPVPVTGLVLPPEYLYTVTNSEFRSDVDGLNFTFYQKTVADAAILGNQLNTNTGGPFVANEASVITRISDGALIVATPLFIQAAVDAASPGDTVAIEAGSFTEQVVVDKDLTIVGDGPGSTIIVSPASLSVCASSSYDWYAVLCVINGATVDISDLTVDGDGQGNANYKFMGIAYRDAAGTVDSVEILDVRNEPLDGGQHGVGLNLFNDDGLAREFNLTNSSISGFQKNAMAIATGGTSALTVLIDGNEIVGAGPLGLGLPAQNGIQVYESAGSLTGTIVNNTVQDIAYDNTDNPTKWAATSILNFYSDVDILNNNVSGGHVAIYNIDAAGKIGNNVLDVEKVGVYAYGIIATDPPEVVPSPFSEDAGAAAGLNSMDSTSAAAATLAVEVSRNYLTFTGVDNTDTYGISAEAGYGPDDLSLTVTENSVSGFDYGVDFYQCIPSGTCTGSGVFSSIFAKNNRVMDNSTTGMGSNLSYLTVNAEDIWWGEPTGPEDSSDDTGSGGYYNPTGTGNAVTDGIDYVPWDVNIPIYDSVPTNYPGSYPSYGFQAQSIYELGDHVAFARTERNLQKVVVSMTNWACENDFDWTGSAWVVNPDRGTEGCLTTPGSSYYHDITFNIYAVNDTVSPVAPGALLATLTDSFEIPFRPSADTVNCTGDRWLDPLTNKCSNGYNFTISYDFSAEGIVLPDEVIYGLAYDTQSYGANPIGANGPYNSLNFSLATSPAEIGTDVNDAAIFSDSTWSGHYCDSGAGGTGTFRYNGDCYKGVDYIYVPAVEFYARTDSSVATVPDDSLLVCTTDKQVIISLADTAGLYGYDIEIGYDADVVSAEGAGAFINSWFDTTSNAIVQWPADCDDIRETCQFSVAKTDPAMPLNGEGDVATIDFSHVAAGTFDLTLEYFRLSDYDGFQIGGDVPSTPLEVTACGSATVSGVVELQGRLTPHTPGTITLTDLGGNFADTVVPFSGGSGTFYATVPVMPVGSDYRVEAEHLLYLGNQLVLEPTVTPLHLDVAESYPAAPTKLRGGDANNDGQVSNGDASCIGAVYLVGGTCGGTGSTDINDDGLTNIQDLAIVGSNYTKATWQPW